MVRYTEVVPDSVGASVQFAYKEPVFHVLTNVDPKSSKDLTYNKIDLKIQMSDPCLSFQGASQVDFAARSCHWAFVISIGFFRNTCCSTSFWELWNSSLLDYSFWEGSSPTILRRSIANLSQEGSIQEEGTLCFLFPVAQSISQHSKVVR